MQLTIDQVYLVRLLIETSDLPEPEKSEAWVLLRECELFIWNQQLKGDV